MANERPPAAFIIADAASALSDTTETSLDDMLSLELERLQERIGRLQALGENVVAIVQSMERKAREVLQDAREPQVEIEEEFDPEELELG